MPELRRDPIIGRWVIVSRERARRPQDYRMRHKHPPLEYNPFAPGHEDETPAEILEYPPPASLPMESGRWWVRVVPNKYPALCSSDHPLRSACGFFDRMNGVGTHEIIIETPDPEATLATMSVEHVSEVLRAFQDRINDLKHDGRLKYILVFKNHGREAGASVAHPHCQLIALPIIPQTVQEELDGSLLYFRFRERCIYCDILDQEMEERVRVVSVNEQFVVIAPWAARMPFETWILPRRHQSHFEWIGAEDRISLAEILQDTLARLKVLLDDPPYNFMIHTSPCPEGDLSYYHWHIEIMPKLAEVAGFEWGSGFYINALPPEEAAQCLRQAVVDDAKEGAACSRSC
jgi:UDPglucose--hexose-1-phosphate uridylyltransferase